MVESAARAGDEDERWMLDMVRGFANLLAVSPALHRPINAWLTRAHFGPAGNRANNTHPTTRERKDACGSRLPENSSSK